MYTYDLGADDAGRVLHKNTFYIRTTELNIYSYYGMRNSVWANFRRNGNNLKPLTVIAKLKQHFAVAKERVMARHHDAASQVWCCGRLWRWKSGALLDPCARSYYAFDFIIKDAKPRGMMMTRLRRVSTLQVFQVPVNIHTSVKASPLALTDQR